MIFLTLLTHILTLILYFSNPARAVAACDIEEERATRRLCDELLCSTPWLQLPRNASAARQIFCNNGWRAHFHCSGCRNLPGYAEPAQCCEIPKGRRAGCFARYATTMKDCTEGPNVGLDPKEYPQLLETEPPIPDLVDEEVPTVTLTYNTQRFILFVVAVSIGIFVTMRYFPNRIPSFRGGRIRM